jgi:phosphatidylinositol glycan class W
LYSSRPVLFDCLILVPAVIVFFLPSTQYVKTQRLRRAKYNRQRHKNDDEKKKEMDPLPVKPFLTTYRGHMMTLTCLAILAVDFRIFPRRFAKVETWGISIMDLGVGSFVFSAGVVGARPVLKSQITGKRAPLSTRLYASMRHSLPLLVLGLIRLYSVKGLDYAEHVTEYGVHWNFFFTLGLLPPFVALFQSLLSYIASYELLALLLAGTYEVLLETTNLKSYILISPRVSGDLLSQNREGVFSFVGYLAIFLAGQGAGMIVMPRELASRILPEIDNNRLRMLVRLSVSAIGWCSLFYLSTSYSFFNFNVSRRLANLSYVLFVASFNTIQLLTFAVIETFFFPEAHRSKTKDDERRACHAATSRVLRAYNKNGLAVFLVANLCTGAVNLGMRTLEMGPKASMGVLTAYALVVSGVALGLEGAGIHIRL